jgi:FKBP-type peptidyl-prolyl cis-trans isomerase SlyD
MIVERDRVVRFHYILTGEAGETIESSRDGEPLDMLHGHGSVIAGVEKALEGRAAGDRFQVTLAPEDGYGQRVDGRVQRVPRKHVRGPKRMKPGDRVAVGTPDGYRDVTVIKVGHSVVDVDLNHPLAGRTLTFDMEILDVRAAEPEELAHGHAHGPGGHAH